MADERKIVIELKAVGSGDGEDEGDGKDGKSPIEDFDKTRKKALVSAAKQIVGAVINEITAEVQYDFNKYCNLSDDYKSQLLLDNSMTTLNIVKSVGSSALSGAMLGAKLGGWGAAAGAAIFATLDAASKIHSYNRQYDQQNLQLELGDMAARYSGSRLGLVDGGRGTQN